MKKAGMEKGVGFLLCLTNKHVLHHNRRNPTFPHSQTSASTTKPRFGFGASVRDGENRPWAKLKGAILEMTVGGGGGCWGCKNCPGSACVSEKAIWNAAAETNQRRSPFPEP